ncbi:RCC1/BLIP-II, partial [Caulochytrium protostelioides]
EAGDVFVLGSGEAGQLGLGPDVHERERPAKLKWFEEDGRDIAVVSICAGGMHSAALTADGEIYTWGCNDHMSLGRPGEETEPGLVQGALTGQYVTKVVCGDSVTACLTTEGRVYAWGTFRDNNGVFGFYHDIKVQDTPLLIEELEHVTAISAGTNHLAAHTSDHKIYTWGVGEQGQLGRKTSARNARSQCLVPRTINFRPHGLPGNRFTAIYCAGYHTFVVHESSAVFGFGLNQYGQLGAGHTQATECVPQLHGVGIAAITGGETHTLLLDVEGRVHCCGRGDSYQLGLGDDASHSVMKTVPNLPTIATVSSGAQFCLALSAPAKAPMTAPGPDGEDVAIAAGQNIVYGWGYGERGQLANGSEDNERPTAFNLKERFVLELSAGGQHSMLLLRKKGQ